MDNSIINKVNSTYRDTSINQIIKDDKSSDTKIRGIIKLLENMDSKTSKLMSVNDLILGFKKYESDKDSKLNNRIKLKGQVSYE